MSYRVGHHRHVISFAIKYQQTSITQVILHSTSDDSFAYRPRAEVEGWVKGDNPLSRFRLFLEDKKWWSAEEEDEMKSRIRSDLIKTFKRAESKKRPELSELFTDIYAGPEPWNIVCAPARSLLISFFRTMYANNFRLFRRSNERS